MWYKFTNKEYADVILFTDISLILLEKLLRYIFDDFLSRLFSTAGGRGRKRTRIFNYLKGRQGYNNLKKKAHGRL